MSNNYDLYFKKADIKIDTPFFERVAKWFISKGWRYLNFWVAGDEIKVSLEDAVKRMPERGSITFMANRHDLSFNYYGRITIDSHPVNFNKNDDFTDLVIEAMTYLYLELKADIAYGALADYSLSEEERDLIYSEHSISCFNIFNPELVKRINKDKLKHINAYRTEYLKDGSLLLVLAKNPLDISEDELKKLRRTMFE